MLIYGPKLLPSSWPLSCPPASTCTMRNNIEKALIQILQIILFQEEKALEVTSHRSNSLINPKVPLREADEKVPRKPVVSNEGLLRSPGPRSIFLFVSLLPAASLPTPQSSVLTSQLTSKKGGRTPPAKRGHARLSRKCCSFPDAWQFCATHCFLL